MLSIDLLNSKKHDRTTFACGAESLDSYIQTRASQELRKMVSTPFVLTDSPDYRVLGYYCLSSYSLAKPPLCGIEMIELDENTTKGLPIYPLLPATLLGRLAVDISCQGKLYGKRLLLDALKRSCDLSKQVASVVLVVDAKSEDAARFYQKYGFIEFQTDPMKLYISMVEIEKLGL